MYECECEVEGGVLSSQQKERLLEIRREKELEDHEEANMVQYTDFLCTCNHRLTLTPPSPSPPPTHTLYTFRVIMSGSTPLVTL